jgi:pectinesterase
MNKILITLLTVVAAAPTPASSAAEPDRTKVRPEMTEGIRQEGSIIFTYVDEKRRRRLTLDVYRPLDGEGPFPAIVMYFGGGWQNGRPGLFAPLAQALAQRGYVCVVPEYRLSGEAPFPAAVHDCKAAIRWSRKSAKRFKIDPNRIACMGGSAGGHLSGFMAASNGLERFEGNGDHREVSSDVQAAIVMCGPMNLNAPDIIERVEAAAKKPEGDAILDFLGGVTPSDGKSVYREASPLSHVSRRTPPMLFIDGQLDRPRVRYTEFWAKLDELQIPHEFVMMSQGPHPFWNLREWFEPTVNAVDHFLQKHLANPNPETSHINAEGPPSSAGVTDHS